MGELMDVPESWEWLVGQPQWDPPEELKAPTSNWMHNLAISMLSSGLMGNDLVEALGNVLSRYAKFNLWIQGEGKRVLDAKELLERAAALERVTATLYEAWNTYRIRYEGNGRKLGTAQDERRELGETLRAAVAALEELHLTG